MDFDSQRGFTQAPPAMRSVLLLVLYLAGHGVALWSHWHVAFFEIALQLFLLLPALLMQLPSGANSSWQLPRIPSWVLVGSIVLFFAAGVVLNGPFVYTRTGGDEWAYRFQASILASGHVTAEVPPVPVFFEHNVMTEGRWFAKFPPGFPVALVAASSLGLLRVMNLILSAGVLILAFLTSRLIYSERESRMALLFLVWSPFLLGNSLPLMSHPFCGFLLVSATYFFFRFIRPGGRAWELGLMLLAVSMAICVRPLTGAAFGVILGGGALWKLRRERRRLAVAVALCVLFGLLTVAVNGAYNKNTTGSFTRFPYAAFASTTIPVEMQAKVGDLVRNLKEGPSSTWLFAFPLLLVGAAYALWRDRDKRFESVTLGLLFVSLVAGYAMNPLGGGRTAGDRFYFEAFFALALLGARGAECLVRYRGEAARRIGWYLAPLALASMSTLAAALPEMYGEAEPYVRVRDAIAGRPGLENAVIFMVESAQKFYPKHLNLNSADWRGEPIFYAPDPGAEHRAGFVRALGRKQWAVVTFDGVTGSAAMSEVYRVR